MTYLVPLNLGDVDATRSYTEALRSKLEDREVKSVIRPPVNTHALEGNVIYISDTYTTVNDGILVLTSDSLDESTTRIMETICTT
tara:strand:- start:37606 stop:37860 length:255 start_codon:yes stop_codon:yes gene_type:complete